MTFRTRGFVAALVLLVAVAAFLTISAKLTGSEADEKDDISQTLVPFSEIKNYDVILDISPNTTQYISGAINLNYAGFLDQDKRLKSDSELAKILGDVGISRNDSVVVYGECQPCGGGPSAATYAYWIMKYLGQENIGLLDGGINNWTAAKLPTEKIPTVRLKANYNPRRRPEMLATYDSVNSSLVQIVDARTPQDRSVGSIPGSINITYDSVLENNKLKDRSALSLLFSSLDKDKPVVVYTATGVKASMVCFALELMGYNASLYTWNDWIMHESAKNMKTNESARISNISI